MDHWSKISMRQLSLGSHFLQLGELVDAKLFLHALISVQCSSCERRSYRVHDPRHVFLKFDRPAHLPIQSTSPILPILYKRKAVELPPSATSDAREDPTAYLSHVVHRETLCDIHSDQIRGVWLRCGHCAAGFDICAEAEAIAHHNPAHGKYPSDL